MSNETSGESTNQPEFMAFWSQRGHDIQEDKVALEPLSFFNEENGYWDEHIEGLKMLEVGQTFTLDLEHIITRVK